MLANEIVPNIVKYLNETGEREKLDVFHVVGIIIMSTLEFLHVITMHSFILFCWGFFFLSNFLLWSMKKNIFFLLFSTLYVVFSFFWNPRSLLIRVLLKPMQKLVIGSSQSMVNYYIFLLCNRFIWIYPDLACHTNVVCSTLLWISMSSFLKYFFF